MVLIARLPSHFLSKKVHTTGVEGYQWGESEFYPIDQKVPGFPEVNDAQIALFSATAV
jgi:hypothetical protein